MLMRVSYWWSFVMLVALVLALAGCDSPSSGFAGMVAKRTQVDGAEFTVRHTEYLAEAIRTNGIWPPPDAKQIRIKGVAAIERVSGCSVIAGSVTGDAALMRADLQCPGAPEALRPVKPVRLTCTEHDAGWGETELDCVATR